MTIVGITLIIAAIAIDVASFALGVRRLRGDGPSGVPVVGLVLFAAGAYMMFSAGELESATAIRSVKWYAVVHFVLQFAALLILDRLISRTR